jgi:glycosyltransferase involved in cell wall biosynthesis
MRVLNVAFANMPAGTGSGGGAEQILSILERGLVERGHQSVVIADKGSRVAADLIETMASPASHSWAIRHALANYAIDVIHFHGLDFHQYVPECETPMLATLHLPVAFYPTPIFDRRRHPGLMMNCVSRSQARSTRRSRGLPVIPSGVPTGEYVPAEPESFLLWLGRICPEKGVHIALEVAHRLDLPLTVAGPVHPYRAHQEYFSRCVKPLLDGQRTLPGP